MPVAVVVDLVRARLAASGGSAAAVRARWAWLESRGVLIAFGLWLAGQRNDRAPLPAADAGGPPTCSVCCEPPRASRVTADASTNCTPGPAVMLCRHASLADSLVSAWVVTSLAGMHPRYVLKRELLVDPCLDIVGNRLPNHFLDRQAPTRQPSSRR